MVKQILEMSERQNWQDLQMEWGLNVRRMGVKGDPKVLIWTNGRILVKATLSSWDITHTHTNKTKLRPSCYPTADGEDFGFYSEGDEKHGDFTAEEWHNLIYISEDHSADREETIVNKDGRKEISEIVL